MKEYNRQTKRWEEPNENVGSLKKKDTCRGQKAHDYVLVLPDYMQTNNQDLAQGIIEKFYESEQRRLECERVEFEYQKSIGIVTRYFWKHKNTRYYECSICGKKHMDI